MIHRPVHRSSFVDLAGSTLLVTSFMHWSRHIFEKSLPLHEIVFMLSIHSNHFVERRISVSASLFVRRFVSRSHVNASCASTWNCFGSRILRSQVSPGESCPVPIASSSHRSSDPTSTLQGLASPRSPVLIFEPSSLGVEVRVLAGGASLPFDASNVVSFCFAFPSSFSIRFGSRTVRFSLSSCRSAWVPRVGPREGPRPHPSRHTPVGGANEGERGGVGGGKEGAEGIGGILGGSIGRSVPGKHGVRKGIPSGTCPGSIGS